MSRRAFGVVGAGALAAVLAGCCGSWAGRANAPSGSSTAAVSTTGVIWHVAPGGDDAHDGRTAGAPLRTLRAAAARLKPGDGCLIHAGVYRETLAPSADGTAADPIVFQAARGEAVTLSGLDQVTGWERVDRRTFRAPLAWDLGAGNQVFRDGSPLTEARWPNRTRADPFAPECATAAFEGSAFDRLQCDAFPEGWTPKALAGATVWCMAQWRWSSWTAPVTNYDPVARTLGVKGHDDWWVKEQHNPGRKPPKWGGKEAYKPAEFFISNARCLLDAPGEWFFDSADKRLYLSVAEGDDPSRSLVEVKRRQVAVDLAGRAYVQVRGLQVVGATLLLKDARHCVVSGVTARHISQSRGGFTTSHVPGSEGVWISGCGNVLRDSEIAYSAGAGVTLHGVSNALVNCFIHDTDTLGAYACCVNMGGARHLVSHNTLRDSGRDCLQYAGTGHLIQFNDISRAGRICHDTGALYQAGCEGGEICYNWVHNVDTSLGNGIYLDNYMDNYLVHHNAIWNISGNAIQLNHPGHYNMVFNNTVFGSIASTYSPWKGQKTLFGSVLANNLLSSASRMKPDSGFVEVATVLHGLLPPPGGFDPARDASQAGIDKGVLLPGVNESFSGAAPDCGAYEAGKPLWRAGHDFAHPPSPAYARPVSFHRSYLVNGSFSDVVKGGPAGWSILQGQAEVKHFTGFNDPPADERFSVIGNSLCLRGAVDARVEQSVEGLKPGADVVFAAYVRCESAKDVVLSVRTPQGALVVARYSAAPPAVWRHVEAHFRLAAEGPVTVEITKEGAGDAYVDVAGLAPLLPAQK